MVDARGEHEAYIEEGTADTCDGVWQMMMDIP
jgi:hypothetical protein